MIDKQKLLDKIKAYVNELPKEKFKPGETYITPAGQVSDGDEAYALAEVALEGRFAEGRFTTQFERDLRLFLKDRVRFAKLCNSGSSANLLAITAITDKVFKSKRAMPGDEVITVASGFPTTVNPIIQNGLVPVFVDVDLGTFVPKPEHIEEMVSKRTKAIVLAHPLGNLFDMVAIRDIADEYDLFLIEDSCDALGGFQGDHLAGTIGDVSTLSFYPAHHITGGEGGATLTNSAVMQKVLDSFCSWGRDCWCFPGKDNTCGKRFKWQLGDLPAGYDHKYIYSRIGYNLKATNMQAAILCAQLKKLPDFVERRRYNWQVLHDGMESLGADEFFVLPKPTRNSVPSWFGFALTVKETAPFSRAEMINWLESHKIGTRLLFGGNLIKQPAYENVHYKRHDHLYNTDIVMNNTFWVGVWPGITDKMLDYMLVTFQRFLENIK